MEDLTQEIAVQRTVKYMAPETNQSITDRQVTGWRLALSIDSCNQWRGKISLDIIPEGEESEDEGHKLENKANSILVSVFGR